MPSRHRTLLGFPCADRGYVVNFGVSGLSGFLSFKDSHAALHLPRSDNAALSSTDARLIVGQPLDVLVEKRTGARLVSVTADPQRVRNHVTGGDDETSASMSLRCCFLFPILLYLL